VSHSLTREKARAAKAAVRKAFAAMAPVTGVGIAKLDGGYGVKVNLGAAPRRGVRLPSSVDGVPVKVEVTGKIRKRPQPAGKQ
jgi:hypothetical protein